MIPKIIHYCWFGESPIPEELQNYINHWREVFPDFEIKQWDENNFNIERAPIFVKEAYSVKKYAFVADYVRMYALFHFGGVYMDTDICILHRFDDLMEKRFFTAMEYHEDNVRILNIQKDLTKDGYRKNKNKIIYDICIESAFIASEKNHPFIKDCLDYYINKHFILPNGEFYDKIIVPIIMALCAEKYGFRYINEFQELKEGIYLLPDEYITAIHKKTNNTFALHMVKNSWANRTITQKIYTYLASNTFIRKIYDRLEKVSLFQRFFDLIQKFTWLKNR